MCARPARSSPSRTSTTGEKATIAATMPTETSSPITSASVVPTGVNTRAAIGPQTAAATSAQSDGLRRSRYSIPVRMPHPLFCITLVG